jgi:hypothetical protein
MKLRLASISLLLAAGLGACAAPEPAAPRRALIGLAPIEAAVRDEAALDKRADCLAPAGVPWFAVEEGDAPILITAPHVTRPFREGSYRFADGGGTGALARALHRLTGATTIYTVAASPSDPNYYDDNDFKRALARLIEQKRPRLVLDIHASHSYRPYDVDLGTMGGASLLGQPALSRDLVAALRAEGLANISLDYFSAGESRTITKFASARGVPTIQLEINTTWLVPSSSLLAAHRFAQLLQARVRYLDAVPPGLAAAGKAAPSLGLAVLECASLVPATSADPLRPARP